MKLLNFQLIEKLDLLKGIALIIVCDDSAFTAATMNNYLWVTYTRCNPSHDIYGIDVHVDNKHWGSKGPLVIDARIKPHHAPPVEKDPIIEQKINRLFEKGGSLYSIA
jgi:4-hydroxy-3-polyprenylbenzoate decarboxylase